jgi:metallo-beta-lactamase family protein
MNVPTVTIHGAAGTVTGSCFEIGYGRLKVLVDCGLFQGPRTLEALNREPFRFDASTLDAVLLTHAHLDHSGLLPRLAAEGFNGSIWCTPATADLLGVMLPDAARIQESDAERRNRRADRADEPAIEPLYTAEHAEQALALLRPIELGEMADVGSGVQTRFWNAGHILGSASVELVAGETRLLFSGDLGPEHKSFHDDPQGPRGVDHLFCESTYGDRDRAVVTIAERRNALEAEVKAALERGGNLVIPVFALERTQELLLDIAKLSDSGRLPSPRVFIDSPLASRATEVFRRHRGELEDVDGSEVFRHPNFHFVESVEQSQGLNNMSGAIILAASGMCEAGRIRHHLRHNLPRPESTVLFVGYQAQGTLGRTIMEGARRVRISGRDVAVRAQIRRIDSYSAHADHEELVAWVKARQPVHGSLFLTHGESSGLERLRLDTSAFLPSVIVPEIGERYELTPGEPASRLTTGRAELRDVLTRDWQNDYADLAANMKRALQQIEGDKRRSEAVAKMRRILADYSRHREHRRTGAAGHEGGRREATKARKAAE